MPFITEELWQNITARIDIVPRTGSIMVAPWPQAIPGDTDIEAERVMAAIVDIVRAVRNARAENGVEPARQIEARIYAGELKGAIAGQSAAIRVLAKTTVSVYDRKDYRAAENALCLVLKDADVIIPMESMVDLVAERQKLAKEIGQLKAEVSRLEAMLADRAFTSKAPEAVVGRERARLKERQDSLKRLQERLAQLGPG
jgi:valyl-tRNA synthetase